MVDRGSNISRFHGDRDSAISLVSQLLIRDKVVLQLQKELVDEGKDLNATVAGAYVDDNLEKLKQQVKDELASIEKLKQDLLENDRAMKRQARLDWEHESTRLRELQNQQVSLQRPVGTEVKKEIQQKKSSLSSGISSGLSKVTPFIPMAISILATFCGIPPGLTEIFTGWMADL
ncbi:gTPase, IMAP member 8 [Didymella heteroderae]|uniref:GTPase, IMAP member 8 n=1 Tax=Didymella heteroderae TaxID=1769908 RepID=A0A9P5C1A5_9PLEO|nr:gTPase, IMAP member 8 [Didymella heteroderae]